jgi:lysozyme
VKTLMYHSKSSVQLTESFEGCELKAYQDTGGVWTIGYGHTLNVKPGDTCTLSQAEMWLDDDYSKAETCVNKVVTVDLTQPEFDALCDFVFNVGCGKFSSSTMLTYINKGRFEDAVNEFERWKFVKGTICAGILRRRVAEKQLFESGISNG